MKKKRRSNRITWEFDLSKEIFIFFLRIYRIIFSFLDSKDQCAYSSINSNLSKVRVFYLCMRVKNLLFNVNTTITHLSGTLLFSFEEYYRILMTEIDADELNYFFSSQKISEWMKYNGIRSVIFYTWCKYINRITISSPPMTRVTRYIRKTFWKKISKQKIFLFCWATFFCCYN